VYQKRKDKIESSKVKEITFKTVFWLTIDHEPQTKKTDHQPQTKKSDMLSKSQEMGCFFIF